MVLGEFALLERILSCSFFIWKQICCFSRPMVGDQTRAWLWMWSFSLQARMNLTVVHLWDLWVWAGSGFSESLKWRRGALEREAGVWTQQVSAWLMPLGTEGLCLGGSAACRSQPPAAVSPHQSKSQSLECKSYFLGFPRDIQYWMYLLWLNWKFHHLFYSSHFTLPLSFLT